MAIVASNGAGNELFLCSNVSREEKLRPSIQFVSSMDLHIDVNMRTKKSLDLNDTIPTLWSMLESEAHTDFDISNKIDGSRGMIMVDYSTNTSNHMHFMITNRGNNFHFQWDKLEERIIKYAEMTLIRIINYLMSYSVEIIGLAVDATFRGQSSLSISATINEKAVFELNESTGLRLSPSTLSFSSKHNDYDMLVVVKLEPAKPKERALVLNLVREFPSSFADPLSDLLRNAISIQGSLGLT